MGSDDISAVTPMDLNAVMKTYYTRSAGGAIMA